MDPEIEALIDCAGRDDVFSLMMAQGWTPSVGAPKWVWRIAASKVLERKERAG